MGRVDGGATLTAGQAPLRPNSETRSWKLRMSSHHRDAQGTETVLAKLSPGGLDAGSPDK